MTQEIEPLKVNVFSEFTDEAASVADILHMEFLMLVKLEWKIAPVTCLMWLQTYAQLASCYHPLPAERRHLLDLERREGSSTVNSELATSTVHDVRFFVKAAEVCFSVFFESEKFHTPSNSQYNTAKYVVHQNF